MGGSHARHCHQETNSPEAMEIRQPAQSPHASKDSVSSLLLCWPVGMSAPEPAVAGGQLKIAAASLSSLGVWVAARLAPYRSMLDSTMSASPEKPPGPAG